MTTWSIFMKVMAQIVSVIIVVTSPIKWNKKIKRKERGRKNEWVNKQKVSLGTKNRETRKIWLYRFLFPWVSPCTLFSYIVPSCPSCPSLSLLSPLVIYFSCCFVFFIFACNIQPCLFLSIRFTNKPKMPKEGMWDPIKCIRSLENNYINKSQFLLISYAL